MLLFFVRARSRGNSHFLFSLARGLFRSGLLFLNSPLDGMLESLFHLNHQLGIELFELIVRDDVIGLFESPIAIVEIFSRSRKSMRFPQTAPMFWFKTKWVKWKRLIFLFA